MTFGPYDDGHCFLVEKSDTYKAIQEDVQMAEFLLLRKQQASPPDIWVVEAKSSSPRPGSQPSFDKFIGDIRDKLTNALSVGIASILNRHPNAAADLPELFKRLDLGTSRFRLVLIINGHKKDWLPPLQDALRRSLLVTTKTWALGPNAVVVLNHEGAKHFGLTSAP